VRTAKWQEEGHVPSLIVSRLGAVSDSALRRNERQIHHRNSNWTPGAAAMFLDAEPTLVSLVGIHAK